MQVAQARQKAREHVIFDFFGTDILAQLTVDMRQVAQCVARLTGQRQNARVGMQQAGTVQLI